MAPVPVPRGFKATATDPPYLRAVAVVDLPPCRAAQAARGARRHNDADGPVMRGIKYAPAGRQRRTRQAPAMRGSP
jgi:hypothetical protein